MAGNAPGSHIDPLLFQLFYAGLLVVGMFNDEVQPLFQVKSLTDDIFLTGK